MALPLLHLPKIFEPFVPAADTIMRGSLPLNSRADLLRTTSFAAVRWLTASATGVVTRESCSGDPRSEDEGETLQTRGRGGALFAVTPAAAIGRADPALIAGAAQHDPATAEMLERIRRLE